jgi:hypothetical protein
MLPSLLRPYRRCEARPKLMPVLRISPRSNGDRRRTVSLRAVTFGGSLCDLTAWPRHLEHWAVTSKAGGIAARQLVETTGRVVGRS